MIAFVDDPLGGGDMSFLAGAASTSVSVMRSKQSVRNAR